MSKCSFIVEQKIQFCPYFQKAPCPQKFLATRLQYNRNSSEIYVSLFLLFKFISQMFKTATENVLLKGMLRLNFFIYLILVYFLFRNSVFKLWENLKKVLQKELFFTKSYRFLFFCNNPPALLHRDFTNVAMS